MMDAEKHKYLLLDSQNAPMARGILENAPGSPTLQVLVLDGKAESVAQHEIVQLVGLAEGTEALLGRITRRREDRVLLERLQRLDESARQNLRIPVAFDSFVYPVTGAWKGRCDVQSYDLSCGGIAFYCSAPLEIRERVEIVIPITTSPLIVQCEILRKSASDQDRPLYAAKFVELCNDEESLLQEAVFNVQLTAHSSKH